MARKPVFIVSDVHLGAVPRRTEAAFRRWLLHVKESGSGLIINGDLFDFWFEYRRAVFAEHVRVLALLADLAESGVGVLYLGGNHDWWGGGYLRDRVGVDFRREPVRTRVLGRNLLIAHGDGLGAGDAGYRVVRAVLRSPVTQWIFGRLHPDRGAWIADRLSGTRRQVVAAEAGGAVGDRQPAGGPPGDAQPSGSRLGDAQPSDGPLVNRQPSSGPGSRLPFLQAWASEQLERDRALDIVATGHAHHPAVVEVGRGRYHLSTGDWVTRRSYATLAESGPPVLHDWEG